MRTEDKMRHTETLDTLHYLMREGVEKIAVILRHSHRHFHGDNAREPFMGLTETGRSHAFELGTQLSSSLAPRFRSSVFGRCIETAYLMDKGYTSVHGRLSPHNEPTETLSPFYVKDLNRALEQMTRIGTPAFLRSWFNDEIDETIMLSPRRTADILADYLRDQVDDLPPGGVAFCVSHDWNLYPLKEFKLGIAHETAGSVGFLEGVMVYRYQDACYIKGFQSDPVRLKPGRPV